MTTDRSALARPPGAPDQDDYQSFCAALGTSARGRNFLAEFARRNRHADTEMLLTALDRLEALMRAEGTALERLRDELRMLLVAIRLARPDIDAAVPPAKAAKLASLLDLLERRIDAMVERNPGDLAPPRDAAPAEIERLPLGVVPLPDEPELPIPTPASAQQPPMALVHDPEKWKPVFGQDHAAKNNVRHAVAMPEVTFIASAPPAPVELNVPKPKTQTAPPLGNPLAAIMALSEDERIALFT